MNVTDLFTNKEIIDFLSVHAPKIKWDENSIVCSHDIIGIKDEKRKYYNVLFVNFGYKLGVRGIIKQKVKGRMIYVFGNGQAGRNAKQITFHDESGPVMLPSKEKVTDYITKEYRNSPFLTSIIKRNKIHNFPPNTTIFNDIGDANNYINPNQNENNCITF